MAEILPTNVITSLPEMTFEPGASGKRVLAPPYDMAGFSGSNTLAESRYPYIDGASHQFMGRDPFPMKFKFYFLNSLRGDMFPELFNLWLPVFTTGALGELAHPILGEVNARCHDWTVELAAQMTSGVVVNVTFIESLKDVDDEEFSFGAETQSLAANAEACDIGMAIFDIPYPTGEGAPTSLGHMIDQLTSFSHSARNQIEGALNQAIGTVDKIIITAEGPRQGGLVPVWALHDNLVMLRNNLSNTLNKRLLSKTERVIQETVLSNDHTFETIAARQGNTVSDIMTLNPSLVKFPILRAGTVVKYYRI